MSRTTPHPDAHRHVGIYPYVYWNYVWRSDGVQDDRVSVRHTSLRNAYLLGERGYGDALQLSRFTIGEMR